MRYGLSLKGSYMTHAYGLDLFTKTIRKFGGNHFERLSTSFWTRASLRWSRSIIKTGRLWAVFCLSDSSNSSDMSDCFG